MAMWLWQKRRKSKVYTGLERKRLNEATPEEWDEAAKEVGWGSALDKQVAGDHYKKFKIQPVEFCHVNNIPYLEATAIKYLCRWKDKGGIQDLEKAKHFIELLIELETK